MTIWRMRIARWILMATNTHSEYVIFTDFPLQRWLHDSASILRCLFVYKINVQVLSGFLTKIKYLSIHMPLF